MKRSVRKRLSLPAEIAIPPTPEEPRSSIEEQPTEGMWMAPLTPFSEAERWSVNPPSTQRNDTIDEFPLPPPLFFKYEEEWDELLFPHLFQEPTSHGLNAEEVNQDDFSRDTSMDQTTTA